MDNTDKVICIWSDQLQVVTDAKLNLTLPKIGACCTIMLQILPLKESIFLAERAEACRFNQPQALMGSDPTFASVVLSSGQISAVAAESLSSAEWQRSSMKCSAAYTLKLLQPAD